MDGATIRFVENKCLLAGHLNFANVMSIYADSLAFLGTHDNIEFDFTQVTSSDSAGLALIVEWIKWAHQQNKKIRLTNISGELMSLARASSLDKMINSPV